MAHLKRLTFVPRVLLLFSRSVVSDSLWPHGLYGPWNSPGQNTGVSSSSLLQVIFPTQGLNPGLLHCRQTLYPLSHQGLLHYKIHSKYFIISIYYKIHSNYSDNRLESIQTTLCDPMDCSLPGSSVHGTFQARVLEWVAISFYRGSSQPRDWTPVSHIAGRCFIIWATREALCILKQRSIKNVIYEVVLHTWLHTCQLSNCVF